jgi:hypothetical protein
VPHFGGRSLIASFRTGRAPLVTHPALQKTWQSQAFPSNYSGTGRPGPREHVLLDMALAPEPPRRATKTAEMVISQDVAPVRLWASPPQPYPEPFADVPGETGKHASGPGAVAVVVRPSAQDRVDLLKRFAKAARRIERGTQLDLSTQVGSFGFGDFDARAVAVALVPSHGDVEAEELEPAALLAALAARKIPSHPRAERQAMTRCNRHAAPSGNRQPRAGKCARHLGDQFLAGIIGTAEPAALVAIQTAAMPSPKAKLVQRGAIPVDGLAERCCGGTAT